MTMESIGADQPQIVSAIVGGPAPFHFGAVPHRVAARNCGEIEAVVDVQYDRGARVGHTQCHLATLGQMGQRHAGAVRQCARAAHAERLLGRLQRGRQGRHCMFAQSCRARCGCADIGQRGGEGARIRIAEIEGVAQIAAHRAPPRCDFRCGHAETTFQQAQHRSVVVHLRIHPAAAAPWRDHVHRHTRAQPVWSPAEFGQIHVLFAWRRMAVVVVVGGNRRCTGKPARRACIGRRWRGRRHMVEKAVVLVEHHQQGGATPHCRIGSERVQHACGVRRALGGAGWIWVLAAGRIGNEVAHRWQTPAQHVLAQLRDTARAHATRAQVWIMCWCGTVSQSKRRKPRQRVVGEVVGHVLIDLP